MIKIAVPEMYVFGKSFVCCVLTVFLLNKLTISTVTRCYYIALIIQ